MTTAVATSPEIAAYADPIVGAIERIIRTLDGLDATGLNWQPPAPETNSVYVLAVHIMGSTEEFILGFLDGQQVARDRDAEFAAKGDSAEPLYARWNDLQARLREALQRVGPEVLDRTFAHPRRGAITGRGILMLVAQHTAEHVGHAELTRQLYNASRT